MSDETAQPYQLDRAMHEKQVFNKDVCPAIQLLMAEQGMDYDALNARLTQKIGGKQLANILGPDAKRRLTHYVMTDVANALGVYQQYPDAFGMAEVRDAILATAKTAKEQGLAHQADAADALSIEARVAQAMDSINASRKQDMRNPMRRSQAAEDYQPTKQETLRGLRYAYGMSVKDIDAISHVLHTQYGRRGIYAPKLAGQASDASKNRAWEVLRSHLNAHHEAEHPFASIEEMQAFGNAAFLAAAKAAQQENEVGGGSAEHRINRSGDFRRMF